MNDYRSNSEQAMLEDTALYCPSCGKSLTHTSSDTDYVYYQCTACKRKSRVPNNADTFKKYRFSLNKAIEDFENTGAVSEALEYPEYTYDDAQYHLYKIAVKTENFKKKHPDAETYKTVIDSGIPTPLDTNGRLMRAKLEKMLKPFPLWAKLVIIFAGACVLAACVLVAVFMGKNVKDNETGISVELDYSDVSFADKWGVTLGASEITDSSSRYSAIATILSAECEKFKIFDLNLQNGEKEIQPLGTVTVSVPVPDGFEENNVCVYHISEKGELSLLDSHISKAKGNVIFEAEHFSIYIIAERPYKVSFVPDDGTEIADQRLLWGELVTAPEEYDRVGYTFLGWYNGDTKWEFSTQVVTEDVVLTARWKGDEFTVSYDPAGGTLEDGNTQTAVFGDNYTHPTPTLYGYKFLGWYDDGVLYESGEWDRLQGLSLTARWKQTLFSVNYVTNGGVGMASAKYDSEKGAFNLPTATYSTYPEYNRFLGWYDNPELIGDAVSIIPKGSTGDKTYYAKWDLCTVYNSINATPFAIGGGRIIVDWSNESDTDLLSHTGRVGVVDSRYNNIDIGNDTTEIIFIGKSTKTYTNLQMHICGFAKDQKLTVRLVNFKFTTNEYDAIAAYEDLGSSITLAVEGDCSIGTTYAGGSIINLIDNTLTISGSGALTVTAGNGAEGKSYGGAGSDGGTAIYANSVHVIMKGKLSVFGGAGGAGKKGYNADGGDLGETGGKGGKGGIGGNAITASSVIIDSGDVNLVGGAGGAGGNGGKGDEGAFLDYDGNGGAGGAGGNGGCAISAETVTVSANAMTTGKIVGGNGANGGAGGNGGSGGINESKGGTGGAKGTGGAAISCEYSYGGGTVEITAGGDGEKGKDGWGT